MPPLAGPFRPGRAFAMSSIPNFVTQNFPVKLFRFSDYGIDFYWVNRPGL